MGFFDIFKPKETGLSKINKEIYDIVVKEFTESRYIKSELLPQILNKIKIGLENETGFTNVFNYDDCLSLEEKKSFNLPTRKKISREMINSLSEEGKKLKDPKAVIEHLYYNPYSTITKREELIEMKRNLTSNSDFLGYQVIMALDYNTCIVCGAYDGKIIKTIDELDVFENRKCCNDTCGGCEYIPIQKGLAMSTGSTYAGWFKKLSVQDKKEILGEYYDRYKTGETLKDITANFNDETILKYKQGLKERIKLREKEEAEKPKIKCKRLTEEELQEYRDLLTMRVSDKWTTEMIDGHIESVKKLIPKEQNYLLEQERKKSKRHK
jgi:hypothetical protein